MQHQVETMRRLRTASAAVVLALAMTGCLGTVVGTAADVTIEVAKVPFKVGGAAVDVMSGDDDDKKREED